LFLSWDILPQSGGMGFLFQPVFASAPMLGDGARKGKLEIIGVDFSGARSDKNTWMAQGFMDDQGLTLAQCVPLERATLLDLLSGLAGPAVVALDFPFSVPLDFARYWQPGAKGMPDLWDAATRTGLAEFTTARDAFVATWGEPKRQCDAYYPECFSPLHQANPNLVPMTFYGMRMLARLRLAGCIVPPLDSPGLKQITLLEAMPGATLRALGLPFKGYKNGARALHLRQRILDGLGPGLPAPVRNLEEFREQCLVSHDCLDALVEAITASLWARRPEVFRGPSERGPQGLDPAVLLEGWLYVPAFARFVPAPPTQIR
jgi:hypothetical protein